MPFLLIRLSRLVRARLTGWRLPLAIVVVVFLTSWAAMALVEPADNEIIAPRDLLVVLRRHGGDRRLRRLLPDVDGRPRSSGRT